MAHARYAFAYTASVPRNGVFAFVECTRRFGIMNASIMPFEGGVYHSLYTSNKAWFFNTCGISRETELPIGTIEVNSVLFQQLEDSEDDDIRPTYLIGSDEFTFHLYPSASVVDASEESFRTIACMRTQNMEYLLHRPYKMFWINPNEYLGFFISNPTFSSDPNFRLLINGVLYA